MYAQCQTDDRLNRRLRAALLHLRDARLALSRLSRRDESGAAPLPAPPALEAADVEDAVRAAEAVIRACRAYTRRRPMPDAPRLAAHTDDLPDAIAQEIQRLRTPGGPAIAFGVSGDRRPLPAAATLALLRTAREAVRNAARRAGAEAVCVELTYAAEGARLSVTDDGRGFLPDDVAPGRPLRAVLDRAVEVGGDAAVLAPPQGGTHVTLVVPFDDSHCASHCAAAGTAPSAAAPSEPTLSEFPFFADDPTAHPCEGECDGAADYYLG